MALGVFLERQEYKGFSMRPLKRFGTSKGPSARRFRRQISRTKAPNVLGPMRGGWRL